MKDIDPADFPRMRANSIYLLCLIKKELPRGFFDIQVHCLVHLIDEMSLAGVASSRWMFFFERFMKVVKSFVHQKTRPEGSIAQGWLVQQTMFFATEYIAQIDPGAPRLWMDDESEKVSGEVLCGKGKVAKLSSKKRTQINAFVINNMEIMSKWVTLYEEARKGHQGGQASSRSRKRNKFTSLREWIYMRLKEEASNGRPVNRDELE